MRGKAGFGRGLWDKYLEICFRSEKVPSLYAEKSGFGSVYYFDNCFKKETGMGILQYQKVKKMEKALVYLKSGEYSVTEISSLLGFKNVNYFSNTFKGYYGLSPANFSGIQDRKNL